MITFRKIRKFTGTKKNPSSAIFLQYTDGSISSKWFDVLDISRCLDVKDGHDNYEWETSQDENQYKKALEYVQSKQFL